MDDLVILSTIAWPFYAQFSSGGFDWNTIGILNGNQISDPVK